MKNSVAVNFSKSRKPEWPENALNFESLSKSGWSPAPFRQFIFKVFTRCNLACDYCYVYEMSDQSWRNKPKLMSEDTVRQALVRISEHAKTHDLSSVSISLHGGEPLLFGENNLRNFVRIARESLPDVQLYIGMQSNGTLVNEKNADMLNELGIEVGISIDGDQTANDRHRLSRNKRSTYERTTEAIRLLTQGDYSKTFGGILCVIDLDNDPVATYEHLLSFKPPSLNFMLPYGNWTARPPGKEVGTENQTPYADWLIRIFDRWFDAPIQETQMRTFSSIMNMLLGGKSGTEMMGLNQIQFVVVEADGTFEQVDSLKSAFEGAPLTGMNVFEHSFDEVLQLPGLMARQLGQEALCDSCKECSVASVCGGGLYTDRYRSGSGFLNPSVYCADLFSLITHIHKRFLTVLNERGLLVASK